MENTNDHYVIYRSTHSAGQLLDNPTPWVCTVKMSFKDANNTREKLIFLDMQAHVITEHQFDNNIFPWN
jgi:hypothetical protein